MLRQPTHTLALDPSLAETGYAVLDTTDQTVCETGTIRTRRIDHDRIRLSIIVVGVHRLASRYSLRDMAIELPFVGHNRATALTLGAVRGVLLYVAAQRGIPVYEYTTSQIKSAVTGVPTAPKTQVQAMIARLTGLQLANHNESDAVAVGLTHLRHASFEAAINSIRKRTTR